jgi:tetratricopeptide (TPR) repeat protein
MIHLLISISVATAVFAGLFYLKLHWGIALALAVVAMMVTNFLLGRRINKAVSGLMEQVSQDLKNGKMDRAIRTLEGGMKYGRYQFFIRSQLQAQIGVIHYLKKDFNNAFPFLKKAFSRHWIAQGMLGILYMRRKDKENMTKTFKRAVRSSPKEGLLWNLYAYCLNRMGDKAGAIQALVKAQKKLPSEERIRNNLINLQNNKKMKMKQYGELWLQFHLEKMPGNVGRRPPYPVSQRKRVIRR